MTQVVEEALRAYVPPPVPGANGALARKDAILVKPANGQHMTLDEANAALEQARVERG